MRYNNLTYRWFKAQKKYRNLQRRLQSTSDTRLIKKLLSKIEHIKQRLLSMNKRWKLGVATTVLVAWLTANPAQAQFNPPVELDSLDGTSGFTIDGINAYDRLGYAVSIAGDINGDGIDDLMIASPGNDNSYTQKLGKVYVVFGKNTGFSQTFDLTTLDGSNGFVIDSLQSINGRGITVSKAGDVNNDGIEDIAVGAKYTDTAPYGRKGGTYVIFGKSAAFGAALDVTALNGTEGFVINGIASNDQSGSSVSGSDVNGDGFSDIIIGAPYAQVGVYGSAGSTYVVFGQSTFAAAVELSSLDGTNGFTIGQNVAYAQVGKELDGLGDINGDGIDDIIIGAGYNNPQRVVLFGQLTAFPAFLDLAALDGNNGFTIDGLAPYNSNHPVSGAGDLNGDGINDLIISEPYIGIGGSSTQEGVSYVMFGKNTAFSASFDVATINGNNGFVINGERQGENSGSYLSEVGDVNGDGVDDVLLIAGWEDKSYVIFGKTSPFSSSFNLSSIDGANGIDINGESLRAVDGRGDINGDGIDDIIWGSHYAQSQSNTYDSPGKVYVLFGDNTPDTFVPIIATTKPANNTTNVSASTNLTITFNEYIKKGTGNVTIFKTSDDSVIETIDITSAEVVIDGRVATINPAGKLGAQENYYIQIDTTAFNDSFGNGFAGVTDKTSWVFTSVGANELPSTIELSTLDGSNGFGISTLSVNDYGHRVSSAGDINGDGLDDMLIGVPYADTLYIGAAYVVFGKSSGFSSSLDLTILDGTDGFKVNGFGNDSQGGQAVSNIGDINADGIDDIAIGAGGNWMDSTNNYDGNVYIVFGKSTGFTPVVDVTSLDGTNGFNITGVEIYDGNDNFDLGGGTDVNGDGIDDLIVGAADANPNGLNRAGSAYVLFGSSSAFPASIDAQADNGTIGFSIDGVEAGASFGNAVSGAGDINGDGIGDLIIGAESATVDTLAYAGKTYVIFGNNAGFGGSFDLATIDGSNGFVMNALIENSGFGIAVSSLGDVNGDGVDDVIIGSYYGSTVAGASYIVFGKNTAFSAELDLSTLNGADGFVINGINQDDYAGYAVAGAGDVNGDGFNDILMSAPGADSNGIPYSGETYIVFGKNTSFGASFDLSTLDGTNGFLVAGETAEDYSGFSISGTGDINGDGADDVIISGYYSGSYVVFGVASQAETAGVSTVHYNALLDLYNNTDGSSWTDETNWIVSDSVSTWVGIGVTGTDVISISLPNNNIIGTVPATMANIITLQVLNIANNGIETLPDLTGLVNLDTLDVSGNNLDFASLELNASIPAIEYTDQQPPMVAPVDTVVYVGQPYELNVSVSGNLNNYQWFKDSVAMTGETNDTLSIAIVNRASMGSFYAEVTNDAVPGLVIPTNINSILAAADISGTVKDLGDNSILDDGFVTLFEVVPNDAFDTTSVVAIGTGGTFSFTKAVLADYVFLAEVDTITFPEKLPSYWTATIFWEEADTLFLNANEPNIDILVSTTPPDDPGGEGLIFGTVFEDLPETGRLAKKRGLPKASVSVRRKRGASKGDGVQADVFDLVGYVFTDDDGNYNIPGLLAGSYRFNVQYPGIPMDTINSNVDILITDSGAEVSKLVIATVTEDGIILETSPTGVVDNKYQRWADVYPVPSTDLLYVKLDQYRNIDVLITIKTVTGQTMFTDTRSLSADDPVPLELDIASLEHGVYIIEIQSTKAVGKEPLSWRTRFVKSKN